LKISRTAGPYRSSGMRDSLSKEWINGTVAGSGKDKDELLKSLRKKIAIHVKSNAHRAAVSVCAEANNNAMGTVIEGQVKEKYTATAHVFRAAYYIAYNNRP